MHCHIELIFCGFAASGLPIISPHLQLFFKMIYCWYLGSFGSLGHMSLMKTWSSALMPVCGASLQSVRMMHPWHFCLSHSVHQHTIVLLFLCKNVFVKIIFLPVHQQFLGNGASEIVLKLCALCRLAAEYGSSRQDFMRVEGYFYCSIVYLGCAHVILHRFVAL